MTKINADYNHYKMFLKQNEVDKAKLCLILFTNYINFIFN